MSFYTYIADLEIRDTLQTLSAEREAWLQWKPFRPFNELVENLCSRKAEYLDFTEAWVVIGEDLEPDHPDRIAIEATAAAIMPWKKGPYKLFGMELDAEWRSDYKWDRFCQFLPDLSNQLILDVGCNNGYYLFRLLKSNPRFLLGIDPVPRLWHQFHLLQRFAQVPNMQFEMWGWEELRHWRNLFHAIFCMGILYHHSDPIQILRNLNQALVPGGLLVLESIVTVDEQPRCLFPEGRYAKMRNVWFVPSVKAMCNMLERTKFVDIQVVAVNRHEPAEQRTTRWNPGPSYEDFIQPENPNLTIEGHPAPHRAIVFARKK